MAATWIAGTGSYLPEREVKNEELTQFPSHALQMIREKTGVSSRRVADPRDATSDLAFRAALAALADAGESPGALDALIVATSSPDRLQPATAARVQALLGADKAFAFDVNSVCSGGIFAMTVGDSLIRSGICQRVLVIGAEIYTRFLNPKDFSTFPYFGDGAGAVLLKRRFEVNDRGILAGNLKTDGKSVDVIQIPAGGSMKPAWQVTEAKDYYFYMNGKAVYQFAVTQGSQAILECLEQANIPKDNVSCVIAHQANVNILKELAHRTNIPFERFYVNLDKYGNTAGASTLIALDEARREGRFSKGDIVVMVAFGGGLSWGALAIRI
ncbi:beta-ketoacyl-ACP synthase 3 [Heliobacterium gestii]|uniref:Beta-ketoacyl-ACP synthase 3 n=1 Tax=Heliomicrobium gestii TaxID=2699 RepID=A0A845L8Y7_HELGE|nr:beta-ketoacyl-ACP synthase 3 [Heliomicrobium gestii]MBM7866618.1 3-oxoacyl-[acyl-carrier-protein] synthase-3 [Heliomicrobium gestii]MZP43102.1 beta-ketoacyl-ACP synthase 3 [Heliomicrobium gestii]